MALRSPLALSDRDLMRRVCAKERRDDGNHARVAEDRCNLLSGAGGSYPLADCFGIETKTRVASALMVVRRDGESSAFALGACPPTVWA